MLAWAYARSSLPLQRTNALYMALSEQLKRGAVEQADAKGLVLLVWSFAKQGVWDEVCTVMHRAVILLVKLW